LASGCKGIRELLNARRHCQILVISRPQTKLCLDRYFTFGVKCLR
jgi:hypothetical protein